MKLERIVQIHIGLMASVGAMLLGVAQGDMLLPMLVVFAAATSVVFTDALNWVRLNRWIANLAALIALFVSLIDFFDEAGIQSQLQAVANLLVYLQIVLFYQRKSNRLYWQLIVLSLLQVVVSAALNVPVEFGLLLLLYAALAISTLTFFFVHREISRITTLGRSRPRLAAVRQRRPRKPPWRRLLDARPRVATLMVGRRVAAEVLGRGLSYQIVVMGATTLMFCLVLFYSAPRSESSTSRVVASRAQSLVGFSSELSLNELNDVLQSSETVMRISFRDGQTGDVIRISGDPYIRGSVLTDYVTDEGAPKWKQRSSLVAEAERSLQFQLQDLMAREPRPLEQHRLLRPPPSQPLVRQDVILEPLRESVLFGVYPSFGIDDTSDDVAVDPLTQQLYSQRRRSGQDRGEYRYAIATTAFRGALQVDVTPHATRRRLLWHDFYVDQEKKQLLDFDAERFPKLKEIADEIGDRQRALGASRADIARALRDHFVAGNDYTYSLNFSRIQRDRYLDPIEDFVANHHTGHCEYYASALVMMLRSQGIPARMVVGFHCDEYNVVGGYYQVRQLHAHAWVEVFLEPDEVPRELPPGGDTSPYGGWLRLDPTPGANVDRAVQLERGMIDVVDDVLDYARLLWSDYVLGLTAKRQKESIYAPVSEKADPEAWSEFWSQLSRQRRETVGTIRRFLLSPTTLAAMFLALILSVIWVAYSSKRPNAPPVVKRVSRWTARLTGQKVSKTEKAAMAQRVTFYHRFERLVADLGMARQPGQTHREFAVMAEPQLNELPGVDGDARDFAALVVEAFYRVRFGTEELSSEEASAIDERLSRLEKRVAERNAGSPAVTGS